QQRSWSWLLRNIVLPLGDAATQQHVMRRLRFLEQAQWWRREKVYAERNRLLARLIQTAYNEVPFYRELMDNADVRPADIIRREDLSKLPVVTKDMLRPAYPHRTTRKTGMKTYEACSSGSTGKNFCVREDSE